MQGFVLAIPLVALFWSSSVAAGGGAANHAARFSRSASASAVLHGASQPSGSIRSYVSPHPISITESLAFVVPRGGDQSGTASTKKKRRRRRSDADGSAGSAAEENEATPKRRRKTSKRTSKDENDEDAADNEEEDGTEQIKEAMRRNKDTAAALGDAIRSRADVLRADDRTSSSTRQPPLHGVDASIASLGLGLGSSDPAAARAKLAAVAGSARSDGEADGADHHDGGGVEVATSAVLANYFLQSHGGAHGVQSLLSLLSVLAGLGALFLPPPVVAADGVPTGTRAWIKLILLRRCLLCALAKHTAGLVAVTALSARRIPAVGLRQTRKRIEALALDPVAQYLFYCALLLVWAPSLMASTGAVAVAAGKKAAKKAATTAATASSIVAPNVPWWFDGKTTSFYSTLCLLGPILLREVVSSAWVVSDVFVILASSGGADGSEPFLLSAARSSIDALLNLLFTTSRWKDADAATRQKLLAKLVAKASLFFEILTGCILAYDGVRALSDYTLSPVGARPTTLSMAKRAMCAYLYFNFLMVRRKKISSLVSTLRGGARVPGRILDILLEPKREMGFEVDNDDEYEDDEDMSSPKKPLGLRDYASMALSP